MTEFPPFTQPLGLVTRVKTGVDGDGNDQYGEVTEIVGGVFVPGGTSEMTEGQDRTVTSPSALLPHGTDVTALDAIVYGDNRYEINGDPSDWVSPFDDWAPGIQVQLHKVAG